MKISIKSKIASILVIISSLTFCGSGKESGQKAPSLVIITSAECPHCEEAKPLYQELRQILKGKMTVFEFDINSAEGGFMASRYNLNIVPTLLFLDPSGAESGRIEGDLVREKVIVYTDEIVRKHQEK